MPFVSPTYRQKRTAALLETFAKSQGFAELGVSRSAIYRVFEPYEGIRSYIVERRVANCHAVIAGATQRIYMAQLADQFGFRSGAEFSRAFRRHFGYAPSDAQGQSALSSTAAQDPLVKPVAFDWADQTRQWSAGRT